MPRYGNQEAFEEHRKKQIEEREKYLTDEEKEKRAKIRESNKEASKKAMETTDVVRIKLKALSEEDINKGKMSEKNRWKESAKFLGMSMNKMVEAAVDAYINSHGEEIQKNKDYFGYIKNVVNEQWNEKRNQFFFDIVSTGRAAKNIDEAVKDKVECFVNDVLYTEEKKIKVKFKIPSILVKEVEKPLEDELKEIILQSRQYYNK